MVWKTTLLPLQHRYLVLHENSAISTPALKGRYSSFWVNGADTTELHGSRHHHNRLRFRFISFISYSLPSRTWTGTLLLARDFTSPVSTYSTTGRKLFSLDGQSRTATHVCICHRLSTCYVYQFHHIEIERPAEHDSAVYTMARCRVSQLHHGRI